MQRIQAIIQNEAGIHCRPSALIIKALTDFSGTVEIVNSHGRADVRSMLGMMSLGLSQGTEITIEVDGLDEAAWAVKLKDLFEYHFDFPPQ